MFDNLTVLYINLDERVDRKNHVELQLNKLFTTHTRISAENGRAMTNDEKLAPMIGCALSHIKALKHALTTKSENIIIVEDDFEVEVEVDLAKSILNKHLEDDFNLILLSYHMPLVKLYNINNNKANVLNGQTTCGYLIKRRFIKILINNLESGINKLLQTKDLNTYSLDQYWKGLQSIENKVYASVPRIAKQRNDYSNIVNGDVSYGGSGFMGILSCEKNKHKRDKQELTNSIFNYKYFIGKPELDKPLVDGDIVYLPCGDGYEHLSDKTKHMIQWIINNYPMVDYIFKTDDDISIDFEKLSVLYTNICLKGYDYCGKVVNVSPHVSTYHYGKCSNMEIEKPIIMNNATYCAGGGYFLSKKSSLLLVKNMDKYKNIFEDYSVGHTLNNLGILPVEINIHNNACFW
jgi:GR25 family glycosyltransferase involved in LPS biosynthesis